MLQARGAVGQSLEPLDAPAGSRADRRQLTVEIENRLLAEWRLRGLAAAAMAITPARTIEEIVQDVTERARELIGAHQAVTSFTVDHDWSQSITGLSLSDKYASYRDYNEQPNGTGIYTLVCETNRVARLTQAELEAHPRWRGFGPAADKHPPMRGWLAAPLVAQDGGNLGLIQLSDKLDGEFSIEDEAILVQLAQLTANALEMRHAREELERRIAERTRELAAANERLLSAQQELAYTASRLAMPARGLEWEGRHYPLAEFSLRDMMDCGAAIRGFGSELPPEQFAEALVRYLHTSMVDSHGQRALALVRMFATRRYDELDAAQQEIARRSYPEIVPATRCLTLVATAGDEPAWNDVRRSTGHRAIPLPSPEATARLPMVAQLLRQLGLEVGGVLNPNGAILLDCAETGVFHVAVAAGSAFIPAQEQFVIPYGIQSVIGFGNLLPNGSMFAVILFSKIAVPRETAELIGHLSLSARMAMLARLDGWNRTEAQMLSLDRLLRNHERIVAQQEERVRETMSRLAASNAELEQFAYVASHDLQEPLRKIQAFGNLLVSTCGDQLGDDGRDYLDRMQRAAQRMQSLIEDLLVLSRVLRKSGEFQPVDLSDVVRMVLADLETRVAESSAVVEVGPLPVVMADSTQMRQLFQNLLGNALKYRCVDQPPRVVVTATLVDASPHRRDSPKFWHVTVSDNGIGFDPKHSERIFQPFQRLHGREQYEGTGMGLAICRRIVERHGGAITADSRPAAGASFKVVLPAFAREKGERHVQQE